MAPAERAVLDGAMTAADELQLRRHGHDTVGKNRVAGGARNKSGPDARGGAVLWTGPSAGWGFGGATYLYVTRL